MCFIGNFSNETQQVQVGYGKLYTDYLQGETLYLENTPIELAPWAFKIIIE